MIAVIKIDVCNVDLHVHKRMITEKMLQICEHVGNRLRRIVQKVHTVVTQMKTDLWHLISTVLKKVLIVEDDNDLVKLLKYNLEKEGFKVNYATDGTIALAEARRDHSTASGGMTVRLLLEVWTCIFDGFVKKLSRSRNNLHSYRRFME